MNQGTLSDKDVKILTDFIKKNYIEMYKSWKKKSENSFYIGDDHTAFRVTTISKSTMFATNEEKLLLKYLKELYIDIKIDMLIDITVLSELLNKDEIYVKDILKKYYKNMFLVHTIRKM